MTRHAEKADTSRDAELSNAGRSRAAYLAKLLQDADVEYVHSTDFKRTKATANATTMACRNRAVLGLGRICDLLDESRIALAVDLGRAGREAVAVVTSLATGPILSVPLGTGNRHIANQSSVQTAGLVTGGYSTTDR